MIKNIVRLAVIGLGQRGVQLIEPMLRMDDVEIVGLCDVYRDRTEAAAKMVCESGRKEPFKTLSYEEILNIEGLDAVVVSTSWQCHIEIAIKAMEKGIFTAMEVGGTYNLKECFDLVEAHERTKTPFFFLENCCYGRREMMCLNMARACLLYTSPSPRD